MVEAKKVNSDLSYRYEKLNMEEGEDSDKRLVNETELVGNTGEDRNWRGIAIALLVIVFVCALIVTAVVLVTPKTKEEILGEKFTLDDYFDVNYKPKTFHATWLNDEDKFLYRNAEGSLAEFDCTTKNVTIIMDNTTFRQLDTTHFSISADRQYVLLKYDIAQIFRHSTLASYVVYHTNTREQTLLKGLDGEEEKIQYVTWSPTGHSLVFVQFNNIYYKADIDSVPVVLADGGIPGEIFNGVPDWVYEEEVLGTEYALWWSRKSSYVAYAVFNDSRVSKYYYPVYGDLNSAYGELASIAYPKPGFPNPTIKIKVVSIATKTSIEIMPPTILRNKPYLFTTVAWRSDSSLIVQWLNRAQNFTIVSVCTSTGVCEESFHEDGHGGWVDTHGPPLISKDGSKTFWILPEKDADAGYFNHVSMIEVNTGVEDRRSYLTHNRWEVTKLVSYDDNLKLVYYISTGGDPRRRHLYSVDFARHSTCLTCALDEECEYVSASFSPSSRFFILNCEGPGVPYTSLRTISGAQIAVLENNTMLREKLSKKSLPVIKYVQIEVEDGYKIWGKLLLPRVLRTDEITQYGLVLNVYGGPGTQRVTEKFSIGWETYLTSSQDIIYAFADGRGSGGRGLKFLHQVYKRLGTVEVDDSIAAGKYFSNLHYVDSKKVAIWGWSYGGFVTASVLGRSDLFQCGIAVAPVTDWIYYDSVYTERFMGLPKSDDNLQGYKDANVSRNAANFKNTNFLLIHGTGDDNVHFQNSAQLMKALTEADVYYRTQIYTDKHHGLLGGNTRHHLYATIEDFLFECYNGYSEKHGREPEPVSDEDIKSEKNV